MEAGIIHVCLFFVRCLVMNLFELETFFTRFVTSNSVSTSRILMVTYMYSYAFSLCEFICVCA